tara:strand:+ start:3803 stop:4297 length:495 start_codon:yes stop_codon:yes gene_type:complete
MNIFMLHENPDENVKLHCDKHVVKMILEYAQMLSTAHRVLDGDEKQPELLYKATHKNHPCTKWCTAASANYLYLYHLFAKLCGEYTHRYGKVHLTQKKLSTILATPPDNMPRTAKVDFVNMPQAMPDQYKDPSVVTAYRKYYKGEKFEIAKYTKRDIPDWMEKQ